MGLEKILVHESNPWNHVSQERRITDIFISMSLTAFVFIFISGKLFIWK